MSEKENKKKFELNQLFSQIFLDNMIAFINEKFGNDKIIPMQKKYQLSKQWIKYKEIQDLFVEMNERIISFANKEFSSNKAQVEDFLLNFQKDMVTKKETYISPKGLKKMTFFSAKKPLKKTEAKTEGINNKGKTQGSSVEKQTSQEESIDQTKTLASSPKKGVLKNPLENASAIEKLYYQTKLGQTFLNAINKANEIDDQLEEMITGYLDDSIWEDALRQGGISEWEIEISEGRKERILKILSEMAEKELPSNADYETGFYEYWDIFDQYEQKLADIKEVHNKELANIKQVYEKRIYWMKDKFAFNYEEMQKTIKEIEEKCNDKVKKLEFEVNVRNEEIEKLNGIIEKLQKAAPPMETPTETDELTRPKGQSFAGMMAGVKTIIKKQSTFKSKKNSIVNNLTAMGNNANNSPALLTNSNTDAGKEIDMRKLEVMKKNLIQIHEKLAKKNTFLTNKEGSENSEIDYSDDIAVPAIELHNFVYKIFSTNNELCDALDVKPLPPEKFQGLPSERSKSESRRALTILKSRRSTFKSKKVESIPEEEQPPKPPSTKQSRRETKTQIEEVVKKVDKETQLSASESGLVSMEAFNEIKPSLIKAIKIVNQKAQTENYEKMNLLELLNQNITFSDDDILTISELRSMSRLKVNYRMKVHETLPEILKNYEKLLLMKAELKKFYQKGYEQTKKDFKDLTTQTDPIPQVSPHSYFKIFFYKFLCNYMPERPPVVIEQPSKVEMLHKEVNTDPTLLDDKYLQTSLEVYVKDEKDASDSYYGSIKDSVKYSVHNTQERFFDKQKTQSIREANEDKSESLSKYELEIPKSIEKVASESMPDPQPEILKKDIAVQPSFTSSSWRTRTPEVKSTIKNDLSAPIKQSESIVNVGTEEANQTVSSAKGTLSQESPTREMTIGRVLQNVTEKPEEDTERYDFIHPREKSPEEIAAERRAIQERVMEGIKYTHRDPQLGNPLLNQTKFLYNAFEYGKQQEVKSFWKHILPEDIFGDRGYYGHTEFSQYGRTEWTTNYMTQLSPVAGIEVHGQGTLQQERLTKRELIQQQIMNEKKKFIGYQQDRANYHIQQHYAPRQHTSSGSPKNYKSTSVPRMRKLELQFPEDKVIGDPHANTVKTQTQKPLFSPTRMGDFGHQTLPDLIGPLKINIVRQQIGSPKNSSVFRSVEKPRHHDHSTPYRESGRKYRGHDSSIRRRTPMRDGYPLDNETVFTQLTQAERDSLSKPSEDGLSFSSEERDEDHYDDIKIPSYRVAPQKSELAPIVDKKKNARKNLPAKKLDETINSHVPFDLLEELAKKKEKVQPPPIERFAVRQLTEKRKEYKNEITKTLFSLRKTRVTGMNNSFL